MTAVPQTLAEMPVSMRSSGSYSIQDHWITLDGGRMRYLRDGIGPPLVLLHGLLGYSFSWRYAIPFFSQHHTVHAVDMLGVGFSDRPEGLEAHLRASADRLLRFLDAAGITSCDLLGTSHGGAISMMAAALDPKRINSLVLVAPVNPWSHQGKRIAALLSHPWIAPSFLRLIPHVRQMVQPYLLRRLYGNPQRIRPGTLQGYAEPFQLPGAFRHELEILSTWNDDLADLQSMMPRLADIPTLLLWGDRDKAVVPASIEPLKRNFKNCQVHVMKGVGHLPYEELPDEFNRVVAAFLEK